jgi:hypothetical protein
LSFWISAGVSCKRSTAIVSSSIDSMNVESRDRSPD